MTLFKTVLRGALRLLYRIEVHGLEHYAAAGPRVLIVANHTSFLDALLIGVFLPERLTFAVNTFIARSLLMRPLALLVNLFPMDPTNPLAVKSLIKYLRDDNKAVIFPEGRITVTGALMKVYQGPGLVADRCGAMVLPLRIDGAQYTPFSRLHGRVRTRWFPRIALTLLPPRRIEVPATIRGRARRQRAGRLLADIMTDMMFATSQYRCTLVEALLNARRVHGAGHSIVEDIERQPFSYRQLLQRAFILGELMARTTRHGAYVGVLLPSAVSTVATFLGLQLYGRVPAMLNFSVGSQALRRAVETAAIAVVYTSRRFVVAAKLEAAVAELGQHTQIIFLEDMRAQVTPWQMLRGAVAARLPRYSYRRSCAQRNPDAPAVVLFTSGSEGTPKGVVLSHSNLLANQAQLSARIDFSARDVVLNALPLFHSFGLTAGMLLPLVSGIKVFFYPSPLHYRIIPEMAYDINVTILFGTNTFLAGYARFAHPYDFYSVRYVFAGAEKLQDETRRQWAEKFGVRIFEGYGATETSPALATNTPMDYRVGSVGRLLPAIEAHLEAVPGIDAGGRLEVRGPNVMLGYLRHERPGVLQPPTTARGPGWYDTGDIVAIDERGMVRICGRAKRFAKVAGEMISLAIVEQLASGVWPAQAHAVVSLPDANKGEQLVLLTENAQATRGALLERARADGIGELAVPRRLLVVRALPLLGSGKIDYAAARQYALEQLGGTGAAGE